MSNCIVNVNDEEKEKKETYDPVEEHNRNVKSQKSSTDLSIPVCGSSSKQTQESGAPIWYRGKEADGFYTAAGKTWVYPTNYPVRQYQENIVCKALFNNTLVTLPTGLGKTFIAAVVMYNFYRWYPMGKVIFTAPTKPLVMQQLTACRSIMNLPLVDTVQMTGNVMSGDRTTLWRTKRVFFLTPQVMANDLKSGICPYQDIRCLVIDEAHRAVNEYAYCQVVRFLKEKGAVYRLLALSATPGNDIPSVIQVIKELGINKLEARSEEALDVRCYVHARDIHPVAVQLSPNISAVKQDFLLVYEKYAKRLRECRALTGNITVLSKFQILKAMEKFRSAPPRNMSSSAVGSLISDFSCCMSLAHALDLLQIYGLRAFCNTLTEGGKDKSKAAVSRLKNDLDLSNIITQLQTMLETKPGCDMYLWSHPKMIKLVKILSEHFNKSALEEGSEASPRKTQAIVFCQYRVVVNEVFDLLSSSIGQESGIKPVIFIGQAGSNTGGMNQQTQIKVMKDFRNGVYNTMIATCVAEEGLDIGEVELIIMMEAGGSGRSPVRLVQRAGRTARSRPGTVIALLTAGKEQQKFSDCMNAKKNYMTNIVGSRPVKEALLKTCPALLPPEIKPERLYLHMEPSSTEEESDSSSMKKNSSSSVISSADIRSHLVVEPESELTPKRLKQMTDAVSLPELSFNKIPERNYLFHRINDAPMDVDELLSGGGGPLSRWYEWSVMPSVSDSNSLISTTVNSSLLTSLLNFSTKRAENIKSSVHSKRAAVKNETEYDQNHVKLVDDLIQLIDNAVGNIEDVFNVNTCEAISNEISKYSFPKLIKRRISWRVPEPCISASMLGGSDNRPVTAVCVQLVEKQNSRPMHSKKFTKPEEISESSSIASLDDILFSDESNPPVGSVVPSGKMQKVTSSESLVSLDDILVENTEPAPVCISPEKSIHEFGRESSCPVNKLSPQSVSVHKELSNIHENTSKSNQISWSNNTLFNYLSDDQSTVHSQKNGESTSNRNSQNKKEGYGGLSDETLQRVCAVSSPFGEMCLRGDVTSNSKASTSVYRELDHTMSRNCQKLVSFSCQKDSAIDAVTPSVCIHEKEVSLKNSDSITVNTRVGGMLTDVNNQINTFVNKKSEGKNCPDTPFGNKLKKSLSSVHKMASSTPNIKSKTFQADVSPIKESTENWDVSHLLDLSSSDSNPPQEATTMYGITQLVNMIVDDQIDKKDSISGTSSNVIDRLFDGEDHIFTQVDEAVLSQSINKKSGDDLLGEEDKIFSNLDQLLKNIEKEVKPKQYSSKDIFGFEKSCVKKPDGCQRKEQKKSMNPGGNVNDKDPLPSSSNIPKSNVQRSFGDFESRPSSSYSTSAEKPNVKSESSDSSSDNLKIDRINFKAFKSFKKNSLKLPSSRPSMSVISAQVESWSTENQAVKETDTSKKKLVFDSFTVPHIGVQSGPVITCDTIDDQTVSPLKKIKLQKKKIKKKFRQLGDSLIEMEAEVSGEDSSDDDSNDNSSSFDKSFIDDGHISVQHHNYLKSIRSPAVMVGRFKIPDLRRRNRQSDSCSSPRDDSFEQIKSQYCYDSFCVDSEGSAEEEESILEIAERKLEKKNSNKNSIVIEIDSTDNEDSPLKGVKRKNVFDSSPESEQPKSKRPVIISSGSDSESPLKPVANVKKFIKTVNKPNT